MEVPDEMDSQREWLQMMLARCRAMVSDAERRWIKDEEGLVLWLQEMKCLACDAEDVIDELEYEELRPKLEEGSGGSTRSVSRISSQLPHPSHSALVHKIAEIRQRWEVMSREREDIKSGSAYQWDLLQERMAQTGSLLKDAKVFGREKERDEILEFLLSPEGEIGPPSMAITGMGGLGKTTLAQLVYNDGRVTEHFDLKMWVCVTAAEFDVTSLTGDILASAEGTYFYGGMRNLDVLQRRLVEKLKGMRFLLVIDNLWDRNHSKWQQLCAPLVLGEKGSKIVITTRDMKVADILPTRKVMELQGLPFDECWKLFKWYAFVDGESDEEHTSLEAIGKQIVQKLKGVPLSAMAIGGALRSSEVKESEWMRILENEIWELELGEDGILPVLKLSYDQLPPQLRQWFAYCSLYPKNYKFKRQNLIQQWMAQGFLQTGAKGRMEDVGDKYLDDLLARSFFQHVHGEFVMHDLLHDLAHLVSRHDHSTTASDSRYQVPRGTLTLRHLSVVMAPGRPDQKDLQTLYKHRNLRTLVFFFPVSCPGFQISDGFFLGFRTLRVLDLSYGGIETLPDSVGNLRHLRYLDLSGNFLTRLPESLCCLYRLQTLRLRSWNRIEKLPQGICNLISLRHLEVEPNLLSGAVGIGNLACLQELESFPISRGDGIKIEDLMHMNELRGALSIGNLHRVRSREDAARATLNKKQHLRRLEMEWHGAGEHRNSELEEEILEALFPPANLKELVIDGYDGVRCPSWIENGLISNLGSLCLRGCRNLDSLPQLCCLPFLEETEIVSCPRLKELPSIPNTLKKLKICDVGLEELPQLFDLQPLQPAVVGRCDYRSSTPSLSALYVYRCKALRSLERGLLRHHLGNLTLLSIQKCKNVVHWPEGAGFLSTLLNLQELCVENCPRLVALTAGSTLSPTLRKLSVVGCPGVASGRLFVQLHNMSSEGTAYVERKFPDLARCYEEALQHMRTVERLEIEDVEDDEDGVFERCQDDQLVSLICDKQQVWSWRCDDWVLTWRVRLQIRTRITRVQLNSECEGGDAEMVDEIEPRILPREWWQRRSPPVSGRRGRRCPVPEDDGETQQNSFFSACLGDHNSRHLPWASSLRWLLVKGIWHRAFLSLNLPSLEGLWIAHCQGTRLLSPDSLVACHLKGLKELQIFDCPELTLPSLQEAMCSLPSLQHLTIEACPSLSSSSSSSTSNPPAMMASPSSAATLRTLFLDDANLLGDAQFVRERLSSLRGLHVWYADLMSFTVAAEKGLGRIGQSLQHLSIQGCRRLQYLPPDLGSLLPSLKVLSIKDCHDLRCLPERGLPLTLEMLIIYWCQEEQQEYWLKIAHVPVVVVDGYIVRGSYREFLELREKWRDF